MIVAVVVLAVVAVAALGWGATAARAAGAAKARAGELEQQLAEVGNARDEATVERDEQRTRVEALDAEIAAVRGELTSARADADTAFRRATDADGRVMDLEAAVTAAEQRVAIADERLAECTAERDAAVAERDAAVAERDAAVAERDAAVAERDAAVAERDAAVAERDASGVGLASARARIGELEAELAAAEPPVAAGGAADRVSPAEPSDADDGGSDDVPAGSGAASVVPSATPAAERPVAPTGDAWPIEARRLERLWRERVAVVLDGTSPVAGDDPVRGALGVLADASREETGVIVDVRWDGDGPVPAPQAAPVVRVAEELVALARHSDGGELVVTVAPDSVSLVLVTEPLVELDAGLVAAVAALGGTATVAADGTVHVTL